MAQEPTSDVKAAITKGVVAEVVLLVVGGVLYLATDNMLWMIGFALGGSALMLLLLAQAGAFTRRDDRA